MYQEFGLQAGTCLQSCNDHCMPKPPTCGQGGFDWAEWRGPLSWSSVKSPPFAEYDPAVFKSQKPEHDGRTNALLIDNPKDLYGQAIDINLASVIHQGFLLAPESGNYTFIFGQADDIVLVWLGNNAFRGWTRANADIERTYIPPPGDETHTTRHLEQGTYYPVRVAWGDKGGNTAMSVKIIAPNGTELTGQDNGYFRTEACDGSYDKFPPYGPS
ncbi:GLEYA domain-containing protein [Metarhizium album ARSEF 1941]|uniref:GLEYA domain-containing protein n=1 Tax=Metarhizium album (strain ARSEF 1941) TaxID=1081103 RepID=A0A0B2WZZ0_METAS|nr:GLEYA domain-containing protein [Metarhizium album ARSEF 1941]KHN99618.1 GLEYA domain-containing protein [Metarhizium album ARSEF 1941]